MAIPRESLVRKVLVSNLSAPELDRLAASLCLGGYLHRYVRRYVNKGRPWESFIARLPGLGRAYGRTLGRRRLVEGLSADRVTEAGVVEDWLYAVMTRLPRANRLGIEALWQRLLVSSEMRISRRAADFVDDCDSVVASYGTALDVFKAARQRGIECTLNYPIAHHRFQFEFYREEAERAPQFAAMLPQFHWPAGYQARLEEEAAMADRILVGSRFARQSFIGQGFAGASVLAIPYGVDLSRFDVRAPRRPHEGFRVIYVGQLGQRKGLSYLIEGYRRFRRSDTTMMLVGGIVGDPRCMEPYRELFEYRPFVPQAELPELYLGADVFVFPTLVEGMGLVVAEAMACGLPVVTTACGPDDIVRDGIDGFIVPIRDPEAIAERLEQLYRDRELLARMGANARERARQFTWDRYTSHAIAAILERRSSSASPHGPESAPSSLDRAP